ncbi:MAG: hypothetical protein SGI98_11485 [Verrucomicrobiota bacterium]|nr:hypothetical protein [Verrucomicrobiota bacterium]
MNQIQFSHHIPPVWLWSGILLAAALLIVSYLTARNRASGMRLAAFLFLRFLCIGVVFFVLMGPYRIQETKKQVQRSSNLRMVSLMDVSGSMGLADGGVQKRIDLARGWRDQKFIPRLPAGTHLQSYEFNHILREAGNGMVNVTEGGTSLIGALTTLAGLIPDEGLDGVILVSDGADHSGEALAAVIEPFHSHGIPIHTLTVGKPEKPADVKISDIKVKEWSKETQPAEVEATIEQTGLAGSTATLRIFKGVEVISKETITLDSPQKTFSLKFNPPTTRADVLTLNVDLQGVDSFPENNSVPFSVELNDPDKAGKPKIKVLYLHPPVAGNGWYEFQFKFLKASLELDPEVECTVIQGWYSPANMPVDYVSVEPETGYKAYNMQHPVHGFPRTFEALMEYDVVINGSVWLKHFSPQMQKNLVRFVEEGGGGYFISGGDCSFGTGGYMGSPLEMLQPVVIDGRADINSWGGQTIPRFTAEGLRHPVMQIGDDADKNKKIWDKFPPLMAFNLVKRAKPGAIVIADNPQVKNEFGSALIMAVQEVGKGRTIAWTSGIMGDWGIGFMQVWGEVVDPSKPLSAENCDRRYYNKFWNNVVRWLAAPKLDNQRTVCTLVCEKLMPSPGESLPVQLFLRDPSQYKDSMRCRFSLSAADQVISSSEGVWDMAEKCFKTNFSVPQTGDYFVEANLTVDGKIFGGKRVLVACRTDNKEMAQSPANPKLMAQIAQETGGKILDLDHDYVMEPSLLSGSSEYTVRREKKSLWDNWGILCALLGLLSIEWAARRLSGMA